MHTWLGTHIDLILRIISTAATVTIGVAASFLAYQQFKISKSKLKFDLYEKRLELFNRLRDYASEVAMTNPDWNETLDNAGKFYRDTIQCRFFFDKDVSDYFNVIYENGKELSRAKQELERPSLTDEQQREAKKKIASLKSWFFDQGDEMFEVFKHDLSIKSLR
jgi:hypothetical protein